MLCSNYVFILHSFGNISTFRVDWGGVFEPRCRSWNRFLCCLHDVPPCTVVLSSSAGNVHRQTGGLTLTRPSATTWTWEVLQFRQDIWNYNHVHFSTRVNIPQWIHATFYELWVLEMLQTTNVTFKVISAHWQCWHLIGYIWLPIWLPLQVCLYLSFAVSEILSLISQNLKRSRDSEHIPFGGNLSCMHWYSSASISTRNLKCLASPIPKIWLGPKFKKNGSRDSDHFHYGIACHPKDNTWYILPVYKNWQHSHQPFWRYDCERRNWKLAMWPWPRPF